MIEEIHQEWRLMFFVAKSTDGGETFENFKVSETSFTPSSSIFLEIIQT